MRRTRLTRFVLILLLIEFLDEFVFGAREAAWPLIRDDLGLTYAQIGLLLAVPDIIANIIEPFLAVLGDVWRRRVIVLGGGLVFTAALALTAASASFGMLMLSFIALYPASGAFVSLSQATLMDLDPARREHNMARWTFAGSVGVVLGPLALGVGVSLALGWRGVMGLMAGLSLALVLLGFTMPYPGGDPEARFSVRTVFKGVRDAVLSVRRPGVLRWLVLLQFSDLMLDVLLGFLALYLVDVGAATPAQASLAVAVWTGVGLLGDFALIPLLERVRGLRYLRVSADAARAGVLAKARPARADRVVQRRVVRDTPGAALCRAPRPKRHGACGEERFGDGGGAHSADAGARCAAMGAGRGDVAVAGRPYRPGDRAGRPAFGSHSRRLTLAASW